MEGFLDQPSYKDTEVPELNHLSRKECLITIVPINEMTMARSTTNGAAEADGVTRSSTDKTKHRKPTTVTKGRRRTNKVDGAGRHSEVVCFTLTTKGSNIRVWCLLIVSRDFAGRRGHNVKS